MNMTENAALSEIAQSLVEETTGGLTLTFRLIELNNRVALHSGEVRVVLRTTRKLRLRVDCRGEIQPVDSVVHMRATGTHSFINT